MKRSACRTYEEAQLSAVRCVLVFFFCCNPCCGFCLLVSCTIMHFICEAVPQAVRERSRSVHGPMHVCVYIYIYIYIYIHMRACTYMSKVACRFLAFARKTGRVRPEFCHHDAAELGRMFGLDMYGAAHTHSARLRLTRSPLGALCLWPSLTCRSGPPWMQTSLGSRLTLTPRPPPRASVLPLHVCRVYCSCYSVCTCLSRDFGHAYWEQEILVRNDLDMKPHHMPVCTNMKL